MKHFLRGPMFEKYCSSWYLLVSSGMLDTWMVLQSWSLATVMMMMMITDYKRLCCVRVWNIPTCSRVVWNCKLQSADAATIELLWSSTVVHKLESYIVIFNSSMIHNYYIFVFFNCKYVWGRAQWIIISYLTGSTDNW